MGQIQTEKELPQSAAALRALRKRLGVTQTEMATQLGVSFVTVSRWETGQKEPSGLARLRIDELIEKHADGGIAAPVLGALRDPSFNAAEEETVELHPLLDFTGRADAVRVVTEGERVMHGYLYNPAFAKETSMIDALPHQQLAVYHHSQAQARLRFLLADDPGAGKTIMAGLDMKERRARGLIRRILLVVPAGLVGNWQREMQTLFSLSFHLVTGSEATNDANPFVGPRSDLIIVSLDTLRGERMFARLQEEGVEPYDYVVFDEAHKLAASRDNDGTINKTERYRLAEAICGAGVGDARWGLAWSCPHVLLLSATPHMGRDFPYYALWRLLLPEVLPTPEAFKTFPNEARQNHFLRRIKEEMVSYDGNPLFPKRKSDTFSYALSPSEQQLYDETTDYIQQTYSQAKRLNRSAAGLAMSVFQRRLASSTYAVLRSLERRTERLTALMKLVQDAQSVSGEIMRRQDILDRKVVDALETKTADEEDAEAGQEENERDEEDAMGGFAASSLLELKQEQETLRLLLSQARRVYEDGTESKFEKLRELLESEKFAGEKLIIFTEHRDTLQFLVQRLEGIGFAGRVAQIHGGMDYQFRQEQIEFFRRSTQEGGATYLVATDAAGEGINLQFCWLMVNYDLPWNPARLEQRMGRIHRYGQKHDPVYISNLVAGTTREGRVLQTLMKKLDAIREEMTSDKVFDVIGRLLEGVSLRDFLGDAAGKIEADLNDRLSVAKVEDLMAQDAADLAAPFGEVRTALPQLVRDEEQEAYRRLLPGYVRRFLEMAAPLLFFGFDGDPSDAKNGFALRPLQPGALDFLWPALEQYGHEQRRRFCVVRPQDKSTAVFLHPGEPVFDQIFRHAVERLGPDALRGGILTDVSATRPALVHLARIGIVRGTDGGLPGLERTEQLDSRLVALRQEEDGALTECPIETLLLPPAPAVSLLPRAAARLVEAAPDSREMARVFVASQIALPLAEERRAERLMTLEERMDQLRTGFDHQESDLAAARVRLRKKSQEGNAAAAQELVRVKDRQSALQQRRDLALSALRREPDLITTGDIEFLAHALVLPSRDPDERAQFEAQTERIALNFVEDYEKNTRGASLSDVSNALLARAAGLDDWPGFDLLSRHPENGERAIEVKGRAQLGPIEMTENEWIKACNLRGRYWLYVVYNCASLHPRLYRVQDPFGQLTGRERTRIVIDDRDIFDKAE